jgi:hypothetical protein
VNEINEKPGFLGEVLVEYFDGGDFVYHAENLEVLRQHFTNPVNVVFVEAHDPKADKVGDVLPDRVRLATRFEVRPVFAVELVDALLPDPLPSIFEMGMFPDNANKARRIRTDAARAAFRLSTLES